MAKRFYVFTLLLMIFGCSKTTSNPVDENKKIVCEGFFTQNLDYCTATFKLSNNVIGADELILPVGVSMTLQTPTELINFSEVEAGKFRSDTTFKGVYGSEYHISFDYNGKKYDTKTKMPFETTINSIVFEPIQDGIAAKNPIIKTYLNNSIADQYLKFEFYLKESNAGGTEIYWKKIDFPFYRITKIPVGENVAIKVPINDLDEIAVQNGTTVKVKAMVIAKEIGEYFIKMENYLTTQLANGQYNNPPKFFSNGGYGFFYGAQVYSITHTY